MRWSAPFKGLALVLAVMGAAACDGAADGAAATGEDRAETVAADPKAARYVALCAQGGPSKAACRCRWRLLEDRLSAAERDLLLILRERSQALDRTLDELDDEPARPGQALGDLFGGLVDNLGDLEGLADSFGMSVPELMVRTHDVARTEARVARVCAERIRSL
ncbi:hypothetical protein EV659_109137 [Rhodothalassium salexigens DSM 2132]|uniref:Heavy-metal resistance protein n=1 Tax=Rhodothalassium salexigens DSM 2132 TaxID=1188247 RepID=A0A4R2PC31_RHOSA|nr:hypothetical protein [Rhodothalassium salexigens]MBB4212207.1 hypothetical protein [Rhodothalassium salexigens DSM 2132]MBK1639686.1 hypothetical protein [Rhodothalassium salexigens DSM 2132]TCP32642.1 hypothetical protein EV659_109137 [Rhodothalassium salexigens DSM 2132]